MRAFAQLYQALDRSTKTTAKVRAMADYLRQAAPADAAWAIFFLSGRRLPAPVTGPRLRQWAAEAAGLPHWLFTESYSAVGDLAETIALLEPAPAAEVPAEATPPPPAGELLAVPATPSPTPPRPRWTPSQTSWPPGCCRCRPLGPRCSKRCCWPPGGSSPKPRGLSSTS